MKSLLFGFEGRVNGPADNMTSSCLSCHARAQTPRAAGGLAGAMPDVKCEYAKLRTEFGI